MAKLDKRVEALTVVRRAIAEQQRVVDEALETLQALPEYRALETAGARLRELRANEDAIQEEVRELALREYQKTGNKRPHSAVQIKVFTVLAYDNDKALDYCRQHLPGALKLDKRAFEKVAKAANLEFISVTKVPKATISRGL